MSSSSSRNALHTAWGQEWEGTGSFGSVAVLFPDTRLFALCSRTEGHYFCPR